MIISHARKFIFFHNPKCAGTSFREALKPYHDDDFNFWGIFYASYFRNRIDHTHLRLWEMQAQFARLIKCAADYNSLIFVRDPYARFLSAVNEHMKKFQPQINLMEMTSPQRVKVVEAFVLNELTIARITTDWRFIHFSPQLWYLQLGGNTIPRHIIPMLPDNEFIKTGLARLGLPVLPMPHHNLSPVDLRAVLESPVIVKFITEFYAEDLAFFEADPALGMLASGKSRMVVPTPMFRFSRG